MQSIEDWCIAIAMHTRLTHEALEAKGGGLSGASLSATNAQTRSLKVFDATVGRLERVLSGFASSMASRAQGLASRGMQGTVEQAQSDWAMTQLSREMAAVFRPITQMLTYGASKLAAAMQKMTGSQQNRALGLLGGAGLGYMAAGPGGALAGAMVGPSVMGGLTGGAGGGATGRYDPYTATIGGALLGLRTGGPLGAIGGALAGNVAGTGGMSYYSQARGMGLNQLESASLAAAPTMATYASWLNPVTVGPAAWSAASGGPSAGDMIRQKYHRMGMRDPDKVDWAGAVKGAKPDERRDVTPFNPEQMDAGGMHARIQTEVIMKTGGEGVDGGGPFQPFMDALLDIVGLLTGIAISSGAPVPRSAEEARRDSF